MSITQSNSPPDDARRVTDQLARDYAEMLLAKDNLLEAARLQPAKISSKEDLGSVSRVIVNIRDAAARAEATRVMEKEPFLRSGQAVDGFFKVDVQDPLLREMKRLNRIVDDYNQALLAAERRRREEEAREAQRVAEEARQKAERARKAETREQAEVQAILAEKRADEAAEATQATPAGMVRQRFDDGPLITMRKIRYVEIADISKIPLDVLRPYIKMSAIEDALKRWATATEYRATMEGVEIGERDESVVR